MVWHQSTDQQAIVFLCSTTQGMLAFSNLCLHKIASNRPKVMKAFLAEDLAKGLKDLDININSPLVQRSLGVSWDIIKDVFMFQVSVTEKPNTTCGVLSTINSLFKPLGFAAPVSIQGRALLIEIIILIWLRCMTSRGNDKDFEVLERLTHWSWTGQNS